MKKTVYFPSDASAAAATQPLAVDLQKLKLSQKINRDRATVKPSGANDHPHALEFYQLPDHVHSTFITIKYKVDLLLSKSSNYDLQTCSLLRQALKHITQNFNSISDIAKIVETFNHPQKTNSVIKTEQYKTNRNYYNQIFIACYIESNCSNIKNNSPITQLLNAFRFLRLHGSALYQLNRFTCFKHALAVITLLTDPSHNQGFHITAIVDWINVHLNLSSSEHWSGLDNLTKCDIAYQILTHNITTHQYTQPTPLTTASLKQKKTMSRNDKLKSLADLPNPELPIETQIAQHMFDNCYSSSDSSDSESVNSDPVTSDHAQQRIADRKMTADEIDKLMYQYRHQKAAVDSAQGNRKIISTRRKSRHSPRNPQAIITAGTGHGETMVTAYHSRVIQPKQKKTPKRSTKHRPQTKPTLSSLTDFPQAPSTHTNTAINWAQKIGGKTSSNSLRFGFMNTSLQKFKALQRKSELDKKGFPEL